MHLDSILFLFTYLKNTRRTDFKQKEAKGMSLIYFKKSDNSMFVGQCLGITNVNACSNFTLDLYGIMT